MLLVTLTFAQEGLIVSDFTFRLAEAAYLAWCKAEGFFPQQASGALSEVDGSRVILRNVNGDLAYCTVGKKAVAVSPDGTNVTYKRAIERLVGEELTS
jgi:hypothetical protein